MPAPLADALQATGVFSIEQMELRGFSRSMAELQWLLVALVTLYYVAPTSPIANPPLFIGVTVLYAASVLVHRYFGLFRNESRVRLAIETWVMMAFITYLLWQTGKVDSPLLNLYLLALIMSGLTLGKTTTMLQLGLVFAIYLQFEFAANGELALSGTDNCARYGGDEFIALLPESDARTALEAAERIRTGVANTSFDFAGQRVQCTVSIGVASYPADAGTLDELTAAADGALYRAKHEGRDRVVAAAPRPVRRAP